MCLRSHFLLFWHLRQAHSPSRPTFLLIVPVPKMTLLSHISLTGRQSLGTLPDNLPPKQPFWDHPGILADVAQVKSRLSTPAQLASFLAASSPHSGDWLQAMPISSCGLRLDDEAVRIGVGLRLGLTLCVPHKCHYGALVDAQGLHGFVCKKAPGRTRPLKYS